MTNNTLDGQHAECGRSGEVFDVAPGDDEAFGPALVVRWHDAAGKFGVGKRRRRWATCPDSRRQQASPRRIDDLGCETPSAKDRQPPSSARRPSPTGGRLHLLIAVAGGG